MPGVTPVLYSLAMRAAAPGLRLLLRLRTKRGKEIQSRLGERRGVEGSPRPEGRLLWIHAASVGEAVSVLPVIAALDPTIHVLLTTGTVTSARLLEERLPQLGLSARVRHRFAPLDAPRWAARFLDHWRPDAAVFVESELWPNLIAACARRGIKLALINARLSPRSHAQWRRAPRFARAVLQSFAWIQARSTDDAVRFRDLLREVSGGRTPAPEVSSPGDLKFAAPPLPGDTAELARLQHRIGRRPVWLAASTHEGEEAIVAALHRALAPRHPGLLTVIAPRHPERGEALAAALKAPRRADGPPEQDGIWIVDTLGELGVFFRLCRVVFVGKSVIAPGGGHNPLEPARLGCAVAFGPYMQNFDDAVAMLENAGAAVRVADEGALLRFVDKMLGDAEERNRLGAAALHAAAPLSHLPARVAADLAALIGGVR